MRLHGNDPKGGVIMKLGKGLWGMLFYIGVLVSAAAVLLALLFFRR